MHNFSHYFAEVYTYYNYCSTVPRNVYSSYNWVGQPLHCSYLASIRNATKVTIMKSHAMCIKNYTPRAAIDDLKTLQ